MTTRSAVAQQTTPPAAIALSERGDHRLVIRADERNRCYVEATAGAKGARFRFLLDSGADGIFFTTRNAPQLGLDPAQLTYDHSYSQWGGTARGATVRLPEFRIGNFVLKNVPATIDTTNYGTPLLGTSVLKVLNFQLRDGSCVLTLPGAQDVKRGDNSRRATHYRHAPRL